MGRYETVEQCGPIQYVIVNASTNGANTILAAVAGKKLRVVFARLIAAGTVNGTFKSNTTAIDGVIPYTAQVGYTMPQQELGWFQTAVGEALNLTLDQAVAVAGIIGIATVG